MRLLWYRRLCDLAEWRKCEVGLIVGEPHAEGQTVWRDVVAILVSGRKGFAKAINVPANGGLEKASKRMLRELEW